MQFDYIAEANVTASNTYHGRKVSALELDTVLTNCITYLQRLDSIKKTLFYGRELKHSPICQATTFDNCESLPLVLAGNQLTEEAATLIIHSIIGKATEACELLELLQTVCFGDTSFDRVNFAEEIGDGNWYDAIGLKAVGLTFDQVQRNNIAKLRARFPNAFTEYDAINRNLAAEREVLETVEG